MIIEVIRYKGKPLGYIEYNDKSGPFEMVVPNFEINLEELFRLSGEDMLEIERYGQPARSVSYNVFRKKIISKTYIIHRRPFARRMLKLKPK